MKKILILLILLMTRSTLWALVEIPLVWSFNETEFFSSFNPRPHRTVWKDKILFLDSVYRLRVASSIESTPAVTLLRSQLAHSSKAKIEVLVGLTNSRALRKYASKVPNKPEGYYLSVDSAQIVLVGADQRGLYYGVQSLMHVLAMRHFYGEEAYVPCLEISDAPDVRWRGVVEGFYGTPWSHQARLSQLDFYGRNKLNVYIYGPKDDPYHSVPKWREPYPEAEAKQIQELVQRAKQNEVDFYWAIHPGQDIKWNEHDRDLLLDKFERMYQLGVRAFAVFFDDISGEGTKADKQAELLNHINRQFIQPKGDVAPLVMCPTEYNKSWSNIEGGYLPTLGRLLDKDIEVMWTGNRVVTTIDKPDMAWINQHIQRKAYIWFNFPVSDFVRNHMLLGATYGNSLEIAEDVSGFLSNPMEHAEASKISLYSIADYTWNMRAYDSEHSWRKAIKHMTKTNHGAKALQTIAEFSSDLGPNGHRFRREESLRDSALLDSIIAGHYDPKQSAQIKAIGRELIRAADVLLTGKDNAALTSELRPWLEMASLLGRYAREIADLYEYTHSPMMTNLSVVFYPSSEEEFALNQLRPIFADVYEQSQALKVRMYQLDAGANANPYQPGVRIATRRLQPALDSMLVRSVTRYNKVMRTNYSTQIDYLPCRYVTDIEQLESQPLSNRGNELSLSPSHEVVRWGRGQSLRLESAEGMGIRQIALDLGQESVAQHFQLIATTMDGQQYVLPLSQSAGQKGISVDAKLLSGQRVRELKLVQQGVDSLEVYLRRFSLVLAQ